MKLIFKPSISTYFCLKLILQFCSTYCDVAHCASVRHIHQLNSEAHSHSNIDSGSGSDERILNVVQRGTSARSLEVHQASKLDEHLRETVGNDPFVYNCFNEKPKYMLEIVIRELFKNSINNEELLHAFLD